jgi:hypothetical protein
MYRENEADEVLHETTTTMVVSALRTWLQLPCLLLLIHRQAVDLLDEKL